MKRKLASTLLLLIVVVEKSQGYGGSGSFSKSFSSSSASSSASSFSSSGSFSANGPLDLTGINSPLKNGLAGSSSFASSGAHADASGAGATSGASSFSGAGTGHETLSGSGASAISGSSSGTGTLPGLISGPLAGVGSSAGSNAVASGGSSSGAVPQTGLLYGPGAGPHSGSLPESIPVQGGSFDLSSPSGADASGGSLTHSGFGTQIGHTGAGDTNTYGTHIPPKVIEGSFILKTDHPHPPSTGTGGYFPSGNGYHSGSSAQANSASYSGSSQSGNPGQGLFPGPNGSIHDFKPAPPGGGSPPPPPSPPLVHVVQTPIVPIHSTIPTNTYTHTDAKDSGLSYNLIISLPGSKGSIYDSQPASHLGTYFSESEEGSYSSAGAHGSQNVHHTNVPVQTQGHYGSHASLPAITSSLPGSTGSIHESVSISKPTITKEIISTLPGRPGSIHESKPVDGYTSGSGTYSGSPSSQPVIIGSGCIGGSCNAPLYPSSGCLGGSCTKPSDSKHGGNIEVVIDVVPGVKPVIPNTGGCSSGYCGVKPAPSNVQVCSGPFCKPAVTSGDSYSGSTSGSYDKFSGSTVPAAGCSGSSCQGKGGATASGYNSASSSFSHSGGSFNQQMSTIGIDLSNPKANCPGGYCDNKPEIPSTPGCSGSSCIYPNSKPTNSYSGSQPGSSLIKPTNPSIDLVAPVIGLGNKPACSGSNCKNSPCSGSSCGTPNPSGVSYVEIPICIGSGCSKPSGNSYHKPSTYENKPSCSGSYCGGKNTASSVSGSGSGSSSGSYSGGTHNQQTPTVGIVLSPTHTPSHSTFDQKPSCSGPNCYDKNPLSTSGAASTSGSHFDSGFDSSSGVYSGSTYDQKPSCSGTYCSGGKPSTPGESHQGAGVVPVGVLVHPQQTSGNTDVRTQPTTPTTVHHKVDGIPQFIGGSGEVLGTQEKIHSIAGPGTGNLPIDQSPTVSYGNIDGGLYVHPSSSSGSGFKLGQKSDGYATGNVVVHKSEGTEIKDTGVSLAQSGSIQPGPLCQGTTCDNNEASGLGGAHAGSSSGSLYGGNSGINIGYNSGIQSGGDSGAYLGGTGVNSGEESGSNVGGSSSGSHATGNSDSQYSGYTGTSSGEHSGVGSGSNTAGINAGNSGGQSGANSGSYSSASSGSYSGGNSGSYSGGNSGGYSGSNSGSDSGGYSGGNSGGYSGGNSGSDSGGYSGGNSGGYSGGNSGSYSGGASGSNSGGYSGSGSGGYGFNLGLGIGKGCNSGNCGIPSLGGGLLGFGVNLGGSSALSGSSSGKKGGSGSYSTAGSSSGSGLTALTDLLHPIGLGGAFSKSGSFSKSGALSGSGSFAKSGALSSGYSSSFASSGAATY